MIWQKFLPILLAIFFAACSQNIASPQSPSQSYEFHPDDYSDFIFLFPDNDINYEVDRILKAAVIWRYTPYKLGGTDPYKGADCSYFSYDIYKKIYNITLERSTKYQRANGKKVPKSKLKTGDLLFFKTDGPLGLHVGIFLKDSYFIHLSSKGGSRIQSLSMRYWSKRFIEARRY